MTADDRRTMRERMLAGDLYQTDAELEAELRQAMALIKRFNDSDPNDMQTQSTILGDLLGTYGEGVYVRPPLYCDFGSHLHIGARTFVNFGLTALDTAPITLGEDVQVGPNVQLLTSTHPIAPGPRRDGWQAGVPITIGDNVWIGGGAVICPGVTIGQDAVVGAGTVVIRDVPAGAVVVGNPARVVRSVYDV
jgi:maltose O-acetyltransferase